MRIRHTLVIVSVSVLLWPSIARGAVTAWTEVIVRVYDASGVIAGTNHAALDLAGKTLSAASVDVIWRVCDQQGKGQRAQGRGEGEGEGQGAKDQGQRARCDSPMRNGELAIRILRSHVPPGYYETVALGDALIDTSAGAGVLATIYVDRVLWLANEARVDSQTLLGRTIAHELGHLLLATRAHGPVGLMRAFWSQEEIRRGRGRDWMFAPRELAAIRVRAQTR